METFCKSLYTAIQKARQELNLHKKTSLGCYHIEERKSINELPMYIHNEIFTTHPNMFLPYHIIENAKITDELVYVTRVIPETGTRIDVYFLQGKHCSNLRYIHVCDVLETFVRVLEMFAPEAPRLVQITILPTKHKKTIDMNVKQPLGPSSINSGVTVKDGSASFVIIYRIEEMFKVLLHELCHLYGFDYHNDDSHIDKNMATKFKVRSDLLRLSESYNESLTVCLYLGFFIFYKRQQHTQNVRMFTKAYKSCYRIVQLYSVKIAAKLLEYYKRLFNGVWVENTSAFAYYVCKCALLIDATKFFKFLNENNKYIHNNPQKIEQFLHMLDVSLKSKRLRQIIGYYMHEIQHIDQSDMFMRTLRMCNFDIAEKID